MEDNQACDVGCMVEQSLGNLRVIAQSVVLREHSCTVACVGYPWYAAEKVSGWGLSPAVLSRVQKEVQRDHRVPKSSVFRTGKAGREAAAERTEVT